MANAVIALIAIGTLFLAYMTYISEQIEKKKLYQTSIYNKYVDIILKTIINLGIARDNISFSYPSLDQFGQKNNVEVQGQDAVKSLRLILKVLAIELSKTEFHQITDEELDYEISSIHAEYEEMYENNLKEEMQICINEDIKNTKCHIICREYNITKEEWLNVHLKSEDDREKVAFEKFILKQPDVLNNYINCCLTIISYIQSCTYYESRIGIKKFTTLRLSQTFVTNDDYYILKILSLKYPELLMLTQNL